MNTRGVSAVVWASVVGAALGMALWVFGVSAWFAAGAGILVAAGGVAWAGFTGGLMPTFVREPPHPRPGTRSDLMQLSWALHGRDGRISDTAVKRLRGFARGRLARAGLDLDDPDDIAGIVAVVGTEAHTTLTDRRRPTLAAVERCLDRLDGVAVPGTPRIGRGHPTP